MIEVDSLYDKFEFFKSVIGTCMPLNSNDYCLVPYRTLINNGGKHYESVTRLRFLLLKIPSSRVNNYAERDFVIVEGIINLDSQFVDLSESDNLQYVSTCANNFIISLNNKSFLIDTLRNIQPINDHNIIKSFEHKGQVHVFTSDNQYLISKDMGANWDYKGYVEEDIYYATFFTINDLVFSYRPYLISKFTTSEAGRYDLNYFSDYSFSENHIKSIFINLSFDYDSSIYVTTHHGLYRADLDAFLSLPTE